jgi:capsular exopolysaccharide synthesis family protein
VELTDYIAILRRFWRSIVVILLTCVAVSIVSMFLLPRVYTAQVQVFLTVLTGNSGSDLASGSNYSQNQVDSFAKVATTPMVLTPVITKLGLETTPDMLARSISVTVPTGTAIMSISASSSSAQTASDIANAVGESLVAAVETLTPVGSDGKEIVRATVVAPATPPTDHSSPSERNTLFLGLLAGLVLGLGQAALRFLLDKRITSEDQVKDLTDVPIMGRLAVDDKLEDDGTARTTLSRASAEDYRRLRTNLAFVGSDNEGRGQAFVVTSALPGEGKTTISMNLAAVLATAGESVLLIDADLRRPRIAKYIGIEEKVGLTTVLVGRAKPADVLQRTQVQNLVVMASGAIPPNPSELLSSARMKQVIDSATRQFRYVIIDCAPLLPVTDSAILSRETDGALLVINANRTTSPQLEESLEAIDTANGQTVGIIVNRLRRDRRGSGSKYGYYYQYGYYEDAIGEKKRRKHSS